MPVQENDKFHAQYVRIFVQENVPENKRPTHVEELLEQLRSIENAETEDITPLGQFRVLESSRNRFVLDDAKLFDFVEQFRHFKEIARENINQIIT